jgi:hypothetical protein
MHENKETARLDLYVLMRLGMVVREKSEDAGGAEQPPRIRRLLGELATVEAREQERIRRSINRSSVRFRE